MRGRRVILESHQGQGLVKRASEHDWRMLQFKYSFMCFYSAQVSLVSSHFASFSMDFLWHLYYSP